MWEQGQMNHMILVANKEELWNQGGAELSEEAT